MGDIVEVNSECWDPDLVGLEGVVTDDEVPKHLQPAQDTFVEVKLKLTDGTESVEYLEQRCLTLVTRPTRRRLNLRSQDLLKTRLFNLLRSPALKPLSPDSKRRAGV